MTIALAQYPLTEHSTLTDWQAHIRCWVEEALSSGAGLLVFPEYGSMELVSLLKQEVRNDLAGQIAAMQELLPDFTATFRSLATEYDCIIVAPTFPVRQENGSYTNRAFVYGPEGEGYQDKWFMTRFEHEEWGISPGDRSLTLFETATGNFGIQICYDVEFPTGTHLLARAGADCILAPSCTETVRGATRVHVGARARALEQQLFTGVSQTINQALWSPAVDLNYGYAAVYSSADHGLPEEGILAAGTPEQPHWVIQQLDFSLNRHIRDNGQVFNFRDSQASGNSIESSTVLRIRLN